MFESGQDVFAAAIVWVVGGFLTFAISQRFRVSPSIGILLYVWHTVFCIFYAWFVIRSGGDAIAYYRRSLDVDMGFSVGTIGVIYLVSVFSNYLALSFLGVALVFNTIGTIGLVAFYAGLMQAARGKGSMVRRAAILIVFLPSVSFWSSGIGKDAISFLATSLALWAALDLRHRSTVMVVAVLCMLYVRPHVAGVMILALMFALTVRAGLPPSKRLVFGLVSTVAAAVVIPFALDYSGLAGQTDLERVVSFVEDRQSYNLHGGGAVDIASMSFPMKLFTYLFRPLPFEANSIFQLAASIDNVILLTLFGFAAHSLMKGRGPSIQSNRVFLWSYSLATWILLALTTANLGISVRQKWMFMPVMLFLLLSLTGRLRNHRHVSEPPPSYSDSDGPNRDLDPLSFGSRVP